MKKVSVILLSILTIFAISFAISPDVASANSNAWEKAGITPDGDINSSGIYDDLDTLVTFVIAIAGFWILVCLVFAGIKLSSAQGGNPQARTQGFIGLGMAFVGGWVILKAYDIAGWIAGFGA